MDDILIDIFNGKQAVSTLGRNNIVVDPALKLKTTHAHRRYLYARECCRREMSGSVVLMLGHHRQYDLQWTGIGLTSSGGLYKSRLTSRSDTQRLVVQLSSWLRRLFIHVLSLSVCPGK